MLLVFIMVTTMHVTAFAAETENQAAEVGISSESGSPEDDASETELPVNDDKADQSSGPAAKELQPEQYDGTEQPSGEPDSPGQDPATKPEAAAQIQVQRTFESILPSPVSADIIKNQTTGQTYPSLQEAVNTAQDGNTIQFLDNVTLDSKVTVTKKIIIDLNGKTLAGAENADWSDGILYSKQDWKNYTLTIKNGTLNIPRPAAEAADAIGIYNHLGQIEAENLSLITSGGESKSGNITCIKNSGMQVSLRNCNIQAASNDTFFLPEGTTAAFLLYAGTYSKDPLSGEKVSLAPGYIMTEENGMFVVKLDEVAKITRDNTIYSTLSAALSKAKAGDTVVLLKDIPSVNTYYSIGKSLTLDLNGHSIGSTKDYTFDINKYDGETITVKLKNGTITNNSQSGNLSVAVFARQKVKLELENMVLSSTSDPDVHGYGLRVGNGETNLAPEVIVGGAATKISGSEAGITVSGSGAYGTAVLVVNDGKITGGYYGIAGNGTYDNTDITVNGGSIGSSNGSGTALYHPQDGNLTITGGTLEGASGVQYLGAGKLSVSGGSLTANGTSNIPDTLPGDGSIADGAALSVISRGGEYGGPQSADISITGGLFVSKQSVAIREYKTAGADTLLKSLKITQGEGKSLQVTGGDGQAAVQLDSLNAGAEVITSGTFSSDVSAYFNTDQYMQNAQDTAVNPGAVLPRAYKLTYDYAGGLLADGKTNPETFTFFDPDFSLENPIKEGYIFEGWTGTGLSQPTKDLRIAQGSQGDRSYKANWTADTASIIFEVKGGSTVASLTGVTGGLIPDRNMTIPTKKDYTFAGWYDKEGNKVEQLPEKFPAGITVYTAKWDAISDKNKPEVKVELPTVSADGSPSAIAADKNVEQTLKKQAQTILAQLQNGQMPHNIPSEKAEQIKTLLENAGSGDKVTVILSVRSEEIDTVDPKERQNIASAAAPGETAVVYLNLSVFMTVKVENPEDGIQTIENIPLSQVDEPILFEIHVDPQLIRGKSVRIAHIHNGNTEIINPVSVDREQGIIKMYGSKFSTYALLTSDTVTVDFDSMGGSDVKSQTVPYHTLLTKPGDPAKPGYIFKGWFREKDYTNAYNFSDPVEFPFTLYAKWIQNEQGTIPSENQGNTPNTTPTSSSGAVQTGDTAHPAAWMLTLLAAFICMSVTVISRRYSQKRKNSPLF